MRHVRTYLAAEPNGLATSWDPPTNFAKLENSPNWLKNPHRLWLENKIRRMNIGQPWYGQFPFLTIIRPFIFSFVPFFVYIDFRPVFFLSISFFVCHILCPTISSYTHFFVYAIFRHAVFRSISFSSRIISLFLRQHIFVQHFFRTPAYSFSHTHFSVSVFFFRSIIRFEARLGSRLVMHRRRSHGGSGVGRPGSFRAAVRPGNFRV